MPRKQRNEKRRQADFATSAAKCQKLSSFFSISSQVPSTNSSTEEATVENNNSKKDTPRLEVTNSPAPSISTVVCEDVKTPASVKVVKKAAHPLVKVQTVESWKSNTNLQWLEYSKTESGFYVNRVWCSICKNVYGDGTKKHIVHAGQSQLIDFVYVNGTSNVKKDTAQSHASSKTHANAVAVQNTKQGKNILHKQLFKLTEAAQHRMEKLFDWAYLIAKTEQSFRQFTICVEMEEKHGSDMGSRYKNDKACRTFIDAIGDSMKQDLDNLIKSQPFYCSLLFDGSTDKTLSEKEVISIKVVEDGVPRIKLLGISHPNSQKAVDIYSSIMEKATEMHLPIDKCCVGAGADGASVNFGKHSGVLTQLESSVPWLLKIHCVAHRLELSLKDAFQGTYFVDIIDEFLLQLYYMFKRSEKKWKNLNQLAEVLNESVVKVTKSQGTRWIDHRLTALKALNKNYKVLRMLFEDIGSGLRGDTTGDVASKMRGYLRHFKTYEFGLYMAAYIDLCEELSILSKSFQSEDMPITSVRANIEVSTLSVRKMLQEPGPQLQRFEEELHNEGGEWFYKEVQLHAKSAEKRNHFDEDFKLVVEKILRCIDSRFVDFFENPLIMAFDVFDTKNFPTEKHSLCTFGNQEIKQLANHFSPILQQQGCDICQIDREWLKLKLDIQRNHMNRPFLELWAHIIREKSSRYPNVIHLVHILLVCPVATSHVERQFSAVKRILGDWRLRMGLRTCEHLLRIITEGPCPKEFSPKKSVALWHAVSVAGRRVDSTPLSNQLNLPISDDPETENDTDSDIELNP